MTKRILFVKDLAELLNTTENSIRCNLQRRNFQAVPKPFYLGARVAWSARIIEEFVARKEAEATELDETDVRKIGRPYKSLNRQG